MSVGSASPPPPTAVFETGASGRVDSADVPVPESCPLCGGPLDPEQEWCLRCGAAARTRLAMSSKWKGPIIAVATVAILSLGVLAVSLVVLVGGGNSTSTNATVSIVSGGPAAASTPAVTTPTATTAPPTAAAPGAGSTGTSAASTPATTTKVPAGAQTAKPPAAQSSPQKSAAPTTATSVEIKNVEARERLSKTQSTKEALRKLVERLRREQK